MVLFIFKGEIMVQWFLMEIDDGDRSNITCKMVADGP